MVRKGQPDGLARRMKAERAIPVKVVLVLDLGPYDRLIAAAAERARTKAGKGSEWRVRGQETVGHLAADHLLEG